MTEEELQAIEERVRTATTGTEWSHPAYKVAGQDVPMLIAEVRRLQHLYRQLSDAAMEVAKREGVVVGLLKPDDN